MTENNKAKPKYKLSINPLVKFESFGHADYLARVGGAACAGLIAFSYLLVMILTFVMMSQNPGAPSPFLALLYLVPIGLAALLAWYISKKRPLWAIWLAFVLVILETIAKLISMRETGSNPPGALFVNLIAIIICIQAVRAGHWLKANRKTSA